MTPFHAFFEECFLDNKDLESIRGRFQIPDEPIFRLPHTSEKACKFAHEEVSFYEASFSYGLRFLVYPFIHHLLSNLNIALGQLVPNAWRTVVSCIAMWFIDHDGEMITLNEPEFGLAKYPQLPLQTLSNSAKALFIISLENRDIRCQLDIFSTSVR